MQVVTAVQSLGRVVSGMHATLGALQKEMARLASTQLPPTESTPNRHTSPGSGVRGASASRASAASAVDEAEGEEEQGVNPLPPPSLSPPLTAFSAMLPADAAKGPAVSLTGFKAHSFYGDVMAKGRLPLLATKQQNVKAKLCISFFNGMATAADCVTLKPPVPPASAPDDGERRKLLVRLHDLILARLTSAYDEADLPVPRDYLKDDYLLPATGISSAVEALKGKVIFDTSSFPEWRLAWEKERESQRESGEAPLKKKKKK